MTNKSKEKIIEAYLLENRQMHYRLAFSYVKNQEDALYIIQDSACKALLSVDSLRDTAQVKPWYCRIIVNTSLVKSKIVCNFLGSVTNLCEAA